MKAYDLPLSMSIGFCKKDFESRLNSAVSEGFDYIDFDICCDRRGRRKYYPYLNKGIDKVLNSGIKVNGVHIAFGKDWDPSVKCSFKRERAVARIISAIEKTDRINPRCYVLHGSFEPISDFNRAERLAALISVLPKICAATDKNICLEILPRTCLLNTAAEAKYVIDTANIKNLKLCVDVNHFLQEKTEDAIYKLGDRIYTLHISDHDYINERHWMPTKGKIDWNAVLGALQKIGYDGVFNYEVDNTNAKELAQNKKMLFENYNGATN